MLRMVVSERKSSEERREEILDAAFHVFAERGYHGASTEEISHRAGISQPYVFRLFGTKKELFIAVDTMCFRRTLEMFQHAAEGKRGLEALEAIGAAYGELLAADPAYLRSQMQAYVACDDPDIRQAVAAGFGELVTYVERVSGSDQETVASFFAKGMLMNVIASMGMTATPEPWATRLLEGCKEPV